MKNKIIAGLSLATVITIGGWVNSYEISQDLSEIIVDANETINQKSTEIANLDNVIVEKDSELKARNLVIDEQKLQINKQEKEIKKLNEEKEKLKEENRNFKNERKGSDAKRLSEMPSRGKSSNYKTINVVATSYIALCDTGCTGITATGIDVRNYPSRRIIAVDPRVIPLHSKVKVSLPNGDSFFAVAEDTGGDIKGNRIDILVATYNEAVQFGRQNVTVTILN